MDPYYSLHPMTQLASRKLSLSALRDLIDRIQEVAHNAPSHIRKQEKDFRLEVVTMVNRLHENRPKEIGGGPSETSSPSKTRRGKPTDVIGALRIPSTVVEEANEMAAWLHDFLE